MTEKTTPAQARPDSYHAVLTPHRSLGPRGFLILMSAVAAVSFVAGFAFLLMGAWPVFGFFGLDAGADLPGVQAELPGGAPLRDHRADPFAFPADARAPVRARRAVRLQPYWASVRLREWPDGRTDLRLVERGRELVFGRFLNDDERRGLAGELKAALLQARGGARI